MRGAEWREEWGEDDEGDGGGLRWEDGYGPMHGEPERGGEKGDRRDGMEGREEVLGGAQGGEAGVDGDEGGRLERCVLGSGDEDEV